LRFAGLSRFSVLKITDLLWSRYENKIWMVKLDAIGCGYCNDYCCPIRGLPMRLGWMVSLLVFQRIMNPSDWRFLILIGYAAVEGIIRKT